MREPALTEYAPPRHRLTGDERRRTILHAARAEFARVGYHGASTASIARVAGCSEPMLYKHFAGKLDLFTHALQTAIEQVHDLFSDLVAEGTNMLVQSRLFLEQLMADPGYLELMKMRRIAVMVDEPRIRELLITSEDAMRRRIDAGLRIGKAQGAVRDDVDADYVTYCWLGFMHAACFRESLSPGAFRDSAEHIVTWMRTLAPLPA